MEIQPAQLGQNKSPISKYLFIGALALMLTGFGIFILSENTAQAGLSSVTGFLTLSKTEPPPNIVESMEFESSSYTENPLESEPVSGFLSLSEIQEGETTEEQTVPRDIFPGTPKNLVLLILDGAGWNYFSEQDTPNMRSISRNGFVMENMRVHFPETASSHSTIFTGLFDERYDWAASLQILSSRNDTIMDSARASNMTVLAVLPNGDSSQLLNKTDGALYDSDNGYYYLDSNLHVRNISQNLNTTLSSANNLSSYSGSNPYTEKNKWVKDSLISILEKRPDRFILLANMPGTDSAAHQGFSDYLPTLRETDIFVGQLYNAMKRLEVFNDTVLIITSDHGMDRSRYGNGVHSDIYNDKTLNVPFIAIGPGIPVKNSSELGHNDDIFPSMAKLLNLSSPVNISGSPLRSLFNNSTSLYIINSSSSYSSGNASTKILIRNTGSPRNATICLNISTTGFAGSSCLSFTASADSSVEFIWQPTGPGIYEIESILYNKTFSSLFTIGNISDMGVSKIYTTRDDENPNKLTVKAVITNYGAFVESGLGAKITVGNQTRDYGPYSTNVTIQKTVSSTWTLSPGWYNISAEVTNYTNFQNDANRNNNIRHIITYLS
jgi:hypothetical protein